MRGAGIHRYQQDPNINTYIFYILTDRPTCYTILHNIFIFEYIILYIYLYIYVFLLYIVVFL